MSNKAPIIEGNFRKGDVVEKNTPQVESGEYIRIGKEIKGPLSRAEADQEWDKIIKNPREVGRAERTRVNPKPPEGESDL